MNETNRNQGFTLIEVLVAVVILGLAYVAVLQNFSVSLRNLARVERAVTTDLEEALLFEQELAILDRGEETAAATGRIYLQGAQLTLVEITSRDRSFKTLRIIRTGDNR